MSEGYHVSPILFFIILGIELLILGVLIAGLYILFTPPKGKGRHAKTPTITPLEEESYNDPDLWRRYD